MSQYWNEHKIYVLFVWYFAMLTNDMLGSMCGQQIYFRFMFC